MNENFAIFIISHKRAENLKTIDMLKKSNYSGKYYIVVDDKDPDINKYNKLYGDKVLVFSKEKIYKTIDTADNTGIMNSPIFARYYCQQVAKEMGLKYYAQFDDDLPNMFYRYEEDGKLKAKPIKNLDKLLNLTIDFMVSVDANIVSFAHSGDYIGGIKSNRYQQKILRKFTNAFILDVNKPIKLVGVMNDDMNTSTKYGSIGKRIFTLMDIEAHHLGNNRITGGMGGNYGDENDYWRAWYCILFMPSCCKLSVMKNKFMIAVNWNNCVPKILSEKWKKHA